MPGISENWLAAEPLLVQRLQERVQGLRAVYSSESLKAVEDDKAPSQLATPAAHVFYLGDRVSGGPNASSGSGEHQLCDQLWGASLVVRNYRSSADARALAGRLIPQIVAAIAGWDCGIKGMRAFRRAPVPSVPRFYDNGKAIFPLIFQARVLT